MKLDIVVLLDRSGSMASARADHEGGIRTFVRDQQQAEGEAYLTFVQFDSVNPCDVVVDRQPITEVDPDSLTLSPRGGTPLLDGIGLSLAHLDERRKDSPSDLTVVMIVTDGWENASKEWTRDRIKARIAELEAKGHTFLYLGANVDAFGEASALGMPMTYAANFNNSSGASISNTYSITSQKLARSREAVMTLDWSNPVVMASAGPQMASSMSYTVEEQSAIQSGEPFVHPDGPVAAKAREARRKKQADKGAK